MKKYIMGVALALVGFSFSWAQKPAVVIGSEEGWQRIGETEASFRQQDESIVVMGADEFAALKIKVEEAPVEIERLQVFYESGEMEEINVKKKINAGEESDVFKLEHPDRDIRKVAFTYSTPENANGEKADVILFGLRADDDRKASNAYRQEEEKELEEARDDTRREAREAARERERALERAERKTEREANQAERKAEREAEQVERKAERASDDINRQTERTESDLERAADDAGDAIAEGASKAAAEVDDQRHDTKVGPDGQTIYISDEGRFYYINDEGKRVYVREAKLKDKTNK